MADVTFDIHATVGVISESSRGWKKEVSFISWNNNPPKYDIREWAPDHQKMGKGITLSQEELIALRDLLNNLDLSR